MKTGSSSAILIGDASPDKVGIFLVPLQAEGVTPLAIESTRVYSIKDRISGESTVLPR
jgi:hypothetical protein